jgi:non-canonical poly(A) RNA polymerase PAPD5/7
LHNEVLSFCSLVSLGEEEVGQRQGALDELKRLVTELWPKATAEVFGSHLTELYLPSSDVDVVVFGAEGRDREKLHGLARELRSRSLCSSMEVVDSARIPIVKYVHAATGIHFDVSFDIESGLRSVDFKKQGYQPCSLEQDREARARLPPPAARDALAGAHLKVLLDST